MITDNLSPENAERFRVAIEGTSLADSDTWIRWWSKTSIQIDGDLTLEELETLVTIMKDFK